jgi:uncharacterized RDD family membrane protein YckC
LIQLFATPNKEPEESADSSWNSKEPEYEWGSDTAFDVFDDVFHGISGMHLSFRSYDAWYAECMNQLPGGIWVRFWAALLDALFLGLPSGVVSSFLGGLVIYVLPGPFGWAFSLLVQLAISSTATYYYYIYFYTKTGATPGKAVFKLKVVDAGDGGLLTKRQVVIRELVGKSISGIIFGIGFLMACFRADKRALHDLMADSRVIQIVD